MPQTCGNWKVISGRSTRPLSRPAVVDENNVIIPNRQTRLLMTQLVASEKPRALVALNTESRHCATVYPFTFYCYLSVSRSRNGFFYLESCKVLMFNGFKTLLLPSLQSPA